MIKVLEIEAQNFLTFYELPPTRVDGLGLVFVKGRNLDDANADSNDSGKTNLFNVISWVLYEKLAKAGNRAIGDEVINSSKGSGCWARVTLELDGKEYSITRWRGCSGKRNGVEIQGALDVSGKRAATNEEIERLLGMTYQMFLSSVFWAQGTATRRLTQLTDAEYKALFDELVGTEHFEEKRKKLARKVTDIDIEVRAAELAMSRKEGAIAQTKTALASAAPKYADVDVLEIRKAKRRADEIKAAAERADRAAIGLAAEHGQLLTRTRLLADQVASAGEEIAKLQASIRTMICPTCGQKLHTGGAKQNAEQAVSGRRAAIKKLEAEFEAANKKLTTKATEVKVKQAEERAARAQAAEAAGKALELVPAELRKRGLDAALALIEEEQKRGAVAGLKEQLRTLQAEYTQIKAGKENLELLAYKYGILQRAYGPLGMKSMRLAELTPLLNEKAAEYSELLSGGALQIKFSTVTELKSGEAREKYCVEVQKDEGVNFQLSGGGMTRKADLIAAFALDEVRELVTGKNISVKIYDEATDGLDAAGEASVVELLRSRVSGTVFFVSHKSLVGENMFDRVWEVCRQDKESRLDIAK